MANIKISELNALTPPAAADELPVVDVSASSTKKTTVGEVVGIINGDVEVASNGTATISELPVSKLQDGAARQLIQTDAAGTGVEWTSNVDVPGTLDVTGASTLDSTLRVAGDVIIADRIIHAGDTNTQIRFPAEDTFSVETNGLERFRVTNDGVIAHDKPAPTAVNATATLTIANLKAGIITSTSAAATDMTLPTGTDTQAGFSGTYDNFTFEWSVINTGPSLVRVLAGTAHTVVGSGSVATGTSGRFASRRTAANTFVTYRLS
jgi:hypothetical protein